MLGAIADDVTGAVDLASNLVSSGFRTRLHFGAPSGPLGGGDDIDAIVVALKSRTAPVDQALQWSGAALQRLTEAGADRIYVKYCSTFDSTPAGNIGPVCDLILDRTHTSFAIVVPSFPANGRTVYRGHLFVGDDLLSESSLAHHPLTPMTDPKITRVMQAQTDGRVANVALETVREGAPAVRSAIDALATDGIRYAVVDAISNDDLYVIAQATADDRVITGGSGLALGMTGPTGQAAAHAPGSTLTGPRVILAGSASQATYGQLEHAANAGLPVFRLDLDDLDTSIGRAFEWALAEEPEGDGLPRVIAPDATRPIDGSADGRAGRAAALERGFGALGRRLVDAGVRRMIVAGGETSGAVVDALGTTALELGATISPGLAWTFATARTSAGDAPVALALKSGNFGSPNFFVEAWEWLK